MATFNYGPNSLSNVPNIKNVINSNGKSVKYYSSSEANIYFGETFIDEVTSISFNVQQQTLPLFGYNSYVFDDVAVGSRLISGQFSVNFTENNFLGKVLDTLQKISKRTFAAQDINDTDIKTPKNKSPLWNKGYDITVIIGNGEHSSAIVLKSVQITGYSQMLDFNGDVVQELYSFIAKDISYDTDINNKNSFDIPTTSRKIVKDISLESSIIDISESKLDINFLLNIPEGLIVKKASYKIIDNIFNKSPDIYRKCTIENSKVYHTFDQDLKSDILKYININSDNMLRVKLFITYEEESELKDKNVLALCQIKIK